MIFEVQSGDKTYEVDAPDQNTAIKSLQGLMAKVKPPGPDFSEANPTDPATEPAGMRASVDQAAAAVAPSVGGDIARSTGSRLAAGALDIPGTLGDLASLADNAGSAAAQGIMSLFGASPERRQQAKAAADAFGRPLEFVPGSEDVKKAVGFEPFRPTTDVGKTFDKYVGTGIELVPSVLASGGSSLLKKGAGEGLAAAVKQGGGDALKYAVAPAAAGEVAGDATKGSAIEPWARLGTTLLTAIAGGRGPKTGGGKALTVDELKTASQDLYDQAKAQGVMIKPAVLDKAIGNITKTASGFGIDPTIHPKSFAALKRLNEFKGVAPVGGLRTVASLEDVDMMRQILGDAASSMDKADAMRAMQMRDQLDNFVSGLKPGDVLSKGDPKAAVNMLLKARSLWSQKAKGEVIGELFRRAEVSAPNFSGSGAENAIRTEFRALAKNQKRMRYFNAEERAAIERVAKGGPIGNMLRMIGKFAPTGVVSSALSSGAGFAAAGPAGAVALPAAGFAARAAATRSTLNKARAVDELVRGGKAGKRAWRIDPLSKASIFYGAAAGRSSDQSK